MIIVSDTSPLCNLALVDHLWLLKSIYQTVIIPTSVDEELKAATNPVITAIPDLDWIQTDVPTNTALTTQLQRDKGLDAGEANAIALALEPYNINQVGNLNTGTVTIQGHQIGKSPPT